MNSARSGPRDSENSRSIAAAGRALIAGYASPNAESAMAAPTFCTMGDAETSGVPSAM
jgi:hypothetical protein